MPFQSSLRYSIKLSPLFLSFVPLSARPRAAAGNITVTAIRWATLDRKMGYTKSDEKHRHACKQIFCYQLSRRDTETRCQVLTIQNATPGRSSHFKCRLLQPQPINVPVAWSTFAHFLHKVSDKGDFAPSPLKKLPRRWSLLKQGKTDFLMSLQTELYVQHRVTLSWSSLA